MGRAVVIVLAAFSAASLVSAATVRSPAATAIRKSLARFATSIPSSWVLPIDRFLNAPEPNGGQLHQALAALARSEPGPGPAIIHFNALEAADAPGAPDTRWLEVAARLEALSSIVAAFPGTRMTQSSLEDATAAAMRQLSGKAASRALIKAREIAGSLHGAGHAEEALVDGSIPIERGVPPAGWGLRPPGWSRAARGVEHLPSPRLDRALPEEFHAALEKEGRRQRRLDKVYSFLHPKRNSSLGGLAYSLAGLWFDFSEANDRSVYGPSIAQRCGARVAVSKIDEAVGFGLFAEEDIPAGGMIGVYAGIVRAKTAEERALAKAAARPDYNPGSKDINGYLMSYSPRGQALRDYVIDARSHGNQLRFVNHSKRNANARIKHVFYGGAWNAVLVAEEPIPKGRQILFDYGWGYWAVRGAVPVELASD